MDVSTFYEKQYNSLMNGANNNLLENWFRKKGEGVTLLRCIKIIQHLDSQKRYEEISGVVDLLAKNKTFSTIHFISSNQNPLLTKEILKIKSPEVIKKLRSSLFLISPREIVQQVKINQNISLFNLIDNDIEFKKTEILIGILKNVADEDSFIDDFKKITLDDTFSAFFYHVCLNTKISKNMQLNLITHMIQNEIKSIPTPTYWAVIGELIQNERTQAANLIIKWTSFPINDLNYLSSLNPEYLAKLIEIDIVSSNTLAQIPNALSAACIAKKSDTALLLLQLSAKPFTPNANGFSPFYLACGNGLTNVVKEMIKHPDFKNYIDQKNGPKNWTALHIACTSGCIDTVLLLLQQDANPFALEDDGFSPFFLACGNGLTDVVREMVKHPDFEKYMHQSYGTMKWTALHVACTYGWKDTALLLLQQDADPFAQDADGFTSFYSACERGLTDVINEMIGHSDVKKYMDQQYTRLKWTALHIACKNDHQNIALLLVKLGASPFIQTEDEFSSYWIASSNGLVDVVKEMKNHSDFKKYIDQKYGPLKGTALQGACACSRINTALLLLELGANPFAQNTNGFTSFYSACEKGLTDVVKEMIKHPDFKKYMDQQHSTLKRTALYAACMNDHIDTVLFLLELGADPFIQTADMISSYDLALNKNFMNVVNEMKKHPGFKKHLAGGYVTVEYSETYLVEEIDVEKGLTTSIEVTKNKTKMLLDKKLLNKRNIEYFVHYGPTSQFKEKDAKEIQLKWNHPAKVIKEYLGSLQNIAINYSNFKNLANSAFYFGDDCLMKELKKWLEDKPDVANWSKHIIESVPLNDNRPIKLLKGEKDTDD